MGPGFFLGPFSLSSSGLVPGAGTGIGPAVQRPSSFIAADILQPSPVQYTSSWVLEHPKENL